MSTVSQAELEKVAGELGEKLGFLLAAAPWPDEVKDAWIYLLDHMSVDEITEFSEIMEFLFADAMTQDIDRAFEAQLAKSREARDAKMVELTTLQKRIQDRLQ